MTLSIDGVSYLLKKTIIYCQAFRLTKNNYDIYPAKSDIHNQNKFPTRMWCGRKEGADWQIGAVEDVIQEVFRAGPVGALIGASSAETSN